MPRSFQEIDRARAVQAIKQNDPSQDPEKRKEVRSAIIAEQDARNEEATAALEQQYDAVFGAAESAPAARTWDTSTASTASATGATGGEPASKPAAKKGGARKSGR